MRHARAMAAGSSALPRFATNRLAVPEGKTQVSTSLLRRSYRTLVTVPSPPEMTTRSKLSASATSGALGWSTLITRMTHSSPSHRRARWNS